MADDRMDISVRAHDPADVEFTQLPSSREVRVVAGGVPCSAVRDVNAEVSGRGNLGH